MTPKEKDKLVAFINELEEMVRIFTVSLHTVHDKDHLNGGARMQLAAMGNATLKRVKEMRELVD